MLNRVLIVDDHVFIRKGVREILTRYAEWEICGEAGNGREAIQLNEKLKPEVIVMDVSMPELDGVETARIIRKAYPNTKIVLLTLHNSNELVRLAMKAGANAYILKSEAEQELITAVQAVSRNETYISPRSTGN